MKIFSQLLANEQTPPQSFWTCIYAAGLMVCDVQLLSAQGHLISRLPEELRNVPEIACVTAGLPWIWSPHSERKKASTWIWPATCQIDSSRSISVSKHHLNCIFAQVLPSSSSETWILVWLWAVRDCFPVNVLIFHHLMERHEATWVFSPPPF